ncbi:MAG: hypothetical protein KF774_11960 [Planctomyces sp.]|nr:hypothetical protein [Planctomyces sp.]
MPQHRMRILIAASLVCVSLGIVRGQDAPDSDAPPAAPREDLSQAQLQLLREFERFEKSLYDVAEVSRRADPERAELLYRARSQSQEQRILAEMQAISEMLRPGSAGRVVIADAPERQEQLIARLQELLKVLQSADERDRVQREIDRVQGLLKDTNRIIGRQRDVRADTSRGGDPNSLADREQEVADDARGLAEKIDRQDAERNPRTDGDRPRNGGDREPKPQAEPGGESPMPKPPGEDGAGPSTPPGEGDAQPQPGETPGSTDEGQPPSGDSPPGDMPPGDQQPPTGDAEDTDGQTPSGETPPSESESSPGQPMPGAPMPGAPMPGAPMPGQPMPGSPPQDGQQPQEGQQPSPPQQGSPSQSPQELGQPRSPDNQQPPGSQPPQQNDPQQSDQRQPQRTPGRDQLEQALEEMQRAIEELRKQERDAATEAQQEALNQMEQLKARLEEILRQLREQETEMMLASLEARLQKLRRAQMQINAETVRLEKLPAEERGNRHLDRSVALSREQRDVVFEADKSLELLKAEGSSVAFPEALQQMRDNMVTVSERLGSGDTGSTTQVIEELIVETLDEMILAMQSEMDRRKDRQQNQQQQRQQQGGDSELRLVQEIAELKLIRSLQNQINRITREVGREIDGEQALDPAQRKLIDDLARRQRRLQQATYDLATGKNE